MLIKYYNIQGDTVIVDDVRDVSILASYKGDNSVVDTAKEYIFDDPEVVAGKNPVVAKVIEYAKDGPCRLFVFGTAYVCTDEGKTIERVVSNL